MPRRTTMPPKPRIAHLAGSNATIQNSPPLVTSNKARDKYGLPPLTGPDGGALRFDALRAQRLAAPVTVYVEQFSAHPLERDAAELYGPPDGYLDTDGKFHRERRGAADGPGRRPPDGRRRGRHRARGARARLLSLPAVSPRPSAGPAGAGADRQRRAARARHRHLRRSDLDPGQPAHRGDGVLAQSPRRHHAADLRQRLPATARAAQH